MMITLYLFLLGAFIVAVSIALIVLPKILLISHKKRLFDMPDKRKVHHTPIPRLGGLSFFPVILITTGLLILMYHLLGFPFESLRGVVPFEFLALLVGSMMLFLVGMADFGVYNVPAWFGMPFTVLIVVYVTNAINLIDGIDGLASGLCGISLVALMGLHLWLHLNIYAILAIASLGVIIPFWFYNVFGNAMRGRKLFMGDSGSLALGYILSFLMVHLSTVDVNPRVPADYNMVLEFTTMLVPLLDVVRVVGHRVRNGKNPFLPDKSHIHHKLLRCGLRVRQVMVTICLLAMLFIVINVLLIGHLNITFILGIDILVWVVFHMILDVIIRKKGTLE